MNTDNISICFDHEFEPCSAFIKTVICANAIFYYLKNTTDGSLDDKPMKIKADNIEMDFPLQTRQTNKTEPIIDNWTHYMDQQNKLKEEITIIRNQQKNSKVLPGYTFEFSGI